MKGKAGAPVLLVMALARLFGSSHNPHQMPCRACLASHDMSKSIARSAGRVWTKERKKESERRIYRIIHDLPLSFSAPTDQKDGKAAGVDGRVGFGGVFGLGCDWERVRECGT